MKNKYNLTKEQNVFLAKRNIVDNIYSNARMEGINITFPQTKTILEGVNVSNVSKLSPLVSTSNGISHLLVKDIDASNSVISATFIAAPNTSIVNADFSSLTSRFSTIITLSNIYEIDGLNISKLTALGSGYGFGSATNLTRVNNIDASNVANATGAFAMDAKLTDVSNVILNENITNLSVMFKECINLVNVSNITSTDNSILHATVNISQMFMNCNNLSDASIQNIINMFLHDFAPPQGIMRNLSNTYMSSPFYKTNISNTRYQNRWEELTYYGWTY